MEQPGQASNQLRATYDRIAPLYDLLDLPFEYGRYRAIRPGVFEQVADAQRLLDCGVGTGRNIPFYPRQAKVTGIDQCPGMLARARRRAGKHNRDVELVETNVLDMPFDDDAFCAASATFLFCVLPDELQEAALREIARVVKPGGRIVLLEYKLSQKPAHRRMMKLWAPWVRFAYGAAFDRRTEDHARNAGLIIEDRRFVHADILVQITARTPE
ncbi:MAG: class I SAM-dependent methyltransferase [Sphingomonadales bacterium]